MLVCDNNVNGGYCCSLTASSCISIECVHVVNLYGQVLPFPYNSFTLKNRPSITYSRRKKNVYSEINEFSRTSQNRKASSIASIIVLK